MDIQFCQRQDEIVLSYSIDGREILEVPSEIDGETAVRQTLRVGAGKTLILSKDLLFTLTPPEKSATGE